MLNFLNSLSIQDAVLAGVAAMLALMGAMFAVTLVSTGTQAALSERVSNHLVPARGYVRNAKASVLSSADDGASFILSDAVSASSRGFLRRYRKDVERANAELRNAHRLADLEHKQNLLRDFDRRFGEYRRNNEAAFALAQRGRSDAARSKFLHVNYYPTVAALSRYEKAIQSEITRTQNRHEASRRLTQTVGAALNAGALGLGVVVTFRLGGSLRRRLAAVSGAIQEVVCVDLMELTTSFRNIAAGDLSTPGYTCTREPIPETGGRELAALASSYNGLISGLADMSERIHDAASDAERRKEAEERLLYLQDYDQITGLANRELLREQLELAIPLRPHGRAPLGAAYLTLEGFKKIDDTFGHAAANELLRIAAARLADSVRETDFIAKGDTNEFIVLLEPIEDRHDAEEIVGKIAAALSRPYVIEGREISVNATAGLSLYPQDASDPDELLRNAHTAMDSAAESNRGGVSPYLPAMRKQSIERLTFETELQRALGANQFELHYQPIVNVKERKITGFEALLRWRHPQRGLLYPSSFIGIAEQSGIIEPIGAWTLQTACCQGQAWREAGHDTRLSVNVSMRQLHQGRLYEAVTHALAVSALPAAALEIELTESLILKERESATATLSALKALGVHVAIDDFGTGYSWYGYLRYFMPNTLKIDRSFVLNISQNTFDEAIAKAMILLGHSLGLTVVAEGIEDRNQVLTLRKLDCDELQGYFFARPANAETCERMLSDPKYITDLLA